VRSRTSTSFGPKKTRASRVPVVETPAATSGSGFAAGSTDAAGGATGKIRAAAGWRGAIAARN